MRKKYELVTPTSCLNKAADDEHIFVLRANDEIAPMIVRIWIQISSMQGKHFDKLSEASQLATQMEEWKKAHG